MVATDRDDLQVALERELDHEPRQGTRGTGDPHWLPGRQLESVERYEGR